jgi:hypothetical protein
MTDDLAQSSAIISGVFQIFWFIVVACVAPFFLSHTQGSIKRDESLDRLPPLLAPWRYNRLQAKTSRWIDAAKPQSKRSDRAA